MKIAVTGASGFVGRCLLEHIRKQDDIEAVALTRSTECPDNDAHVVWQSTDYSVDSLRSAISGCDAVIHLAGKKASKDDTIQNYHSDQSSTENLMRAVAAENVGRIVYASSRLVYGDAANIPWTEETEKKPELLYGANKVINENLVKYYAEKSGIEYHIVRIAQVLGPDEGTRTMINVFQEQAAAGRQLTVTGKSVARRQYIYVGDVADIFIRLARNGSSMPTVVNAGMVKAYTNLEIAEMINAAYDNPIPVNYDDSKPETITSSIMDVSRLLDRIDYTPMDMGEALAVMTATLQQ